MLLIGKAAILSVASLLVIALAGCSSNTSAVPVQTPAPPSHLVGVGGSEISCPSLSGPVVYINPGATAGGDGTSSNPYSSWSAISSFNAGTTYLQQAGTTFSGALVILNSGTSAEPIVIGSYGSGNQPNISGELVVGNNQYVDVCGLSFTAGVAIAGSSNILFHGNTVMNAAGIPNIGLWIGASGQASSGGGTIIDGNIVENSGGDGIAIDHTTTSSTNGIKVTNNNITGNGVHGIELTANYVTVEGNLITGNGGAESGTSGIHCFASGATDSAGSNNTIQFNVTIGQIDAQAEDGNGIELDQYTAGNHVVSNLSTDNDGAGIVVYDSSSNQIASNITHNNGLDPGHSHGYRGEFVMNESGNLVLSNTINTNVFLSDLAGAAAVNMEVPVSSNNAFHGNIEENSARSEVYDLNGTVGNTLTYWNSSMSATDSFSGVIVSAPGGTYDYTFKSGTIWQINGKSYTMAGWTVSNGLYGQ